MRIKKGFTLIELLVVISIIGILLALSVLGMQEAKKSSRDGKRKTDLEQIRSALEMYKSDNDVYPTKLSSLVSKYLATIPTDPTSTTNTYYFTSDGTTYSLCAALEQAPSSSDTTGCGSCTATCNYKVTNP